MDEQTQCPECGAQLIVNLRGHRQFTRGREDLYDERDTMRPVIDIVKHCGTVKTAERMSDLIHDGIGVRARGGLVYFS